MIYHVLPGDAQVNEFRETGLHGEMLVCREALIEGDVSGDSLDEFFNNRAAFINENSGDEQALYKTKVASQFRPLTDLIDSDEVNLWFEYELFCAVNLWFCLSLVEHSGAAIYRVSPTHLTYDDRWNGFGNTDAATLKECFDHRMRLTESEVGIGAELWRAFKRRDLRTLSELTSTPHDAFPYLDEVGRAAAEIDTLPAEVISEIKSEGINNFNEIFAEFRRRAGVFGFGDLQVKKLMSACA